MAGPNLDKQLEQVPPHDEAAEAGVLGSMLIDPRAADIAIEELTADDFYLPRHKKLFTILCQLYETQEQLDELYVCSELSRQNQLEAVGGKDAIGRLVIETPSAANVETYCQVVRDRAVERELIESAGGILKLVREPGSGSDALVEQAETLVYSISDRRTKSDATSMKDLMAEVISAAEKVQAGQALESPALPTNYAELDKLLTGGLWPGELIIVAGRPSMGKTTFALNLVRNVSTGNARAVKASAVFSMEMPKEQVAKNILSAVSSLPTQKMRRFEFSPEEFERFKAFQSDMSEAPIYIDDTSALSVSQLRARCRRLRRRDIRMVVVDYLQLMRGSGRRDSREQEVAEMSRGLKALARELSVPVIVLSQLNRSAERRENEDKRPQLSDLRESGAIEQDADVVIMLYRAEYYDVEKNARNVNVGEAMVLKNRNGPTGSAKLTFLKDILRFETYVPEHDAAAGG